MSRSLGASSLTTRSPIRTSPSVMSSSPAIIRSAVDLPHPDGPTRIMNSPSPISRLICFTASVPSGNRLVTSSITISAISLSPLSLHGARRQPGHDAALEDQHEDDDRHGHDHPGRGDVPGRLGELRLPGEEGERRGNGSRRVRRGEGDREQELVPREDEDQDRAGEHAGRGQRDDHLAEGLERCGPIDLRCLLEVPGDLAEERHQDVDRQRQREGQVGDDQPRVGVVEPQGTPHVEQRPDRRDRRKDRQRQRPREDQRLTREIEAGDRVGGERRPHDRDHRRDQADEDRVDQGLDEGAVVDPPLEQRVVVVERDVLGNERVAEICALGDRGGVLQGHRDDPQHREEREGQDQQDADAPQRVFPRSSLHHLPGLPSAMRTPNPRMKMNAMIRTEKKISTETAEPSPRLRREISWLKPRIDTDSVSCAPRVMMKIVSKTRKASSVRNSSATRIAGFINGSVMRKNRCTALAPSTLAASYRPSSIVVRPASSSRAMNGVVFQTSAMMITAKALKRSPNHALSSAIKGSLLTNPTSGRKANCHANAATTVTIPYGTNTPTRTAPRPKIARYMTNAIAIPITSSTATVITVTKAVLNKSCHHSSELSTAP